MNLSINDPKHWRDRATELRSLAMVTLDDQTQDIMYRLADDYDKLAEPHGRARSQTSPT